MTRTSGAPRVVALCGSLRDDSRTRVVLERALRAASAAGATTALLDLREYDLPPLDADEGDAGDAEALRSEVAAADAVVLGTPNYHGSYSGPLKNALDYCGRDEFDSTTVGLVEVAGGDFPGPALAHLRAVSRTLNAWTLPLQVAVPNSAATVDADGITDPAIERRVSRLGEQLARYAGVDSYPEVADGVECSAPGD